MHNTAILSFNQVLIVTILPWFMLINTNESLCQPSPKRQKQNLRYRVYSYSTGILTCFPFLHVIFWMQLGPTYPWLIYIVKEPLPFRWQRLSLCSDLTTARILIFMRSTSPFEDTSILTNRHTYHYAYRMSAVSVAGLAPSVFGAYSLDE